MSLFQSRTFLLAGLLAGSLLPQASDNTLRTLTTEGMAFKLPPGWEWQSEIASNIAIKKDIKVKDQTYTISAEMVYSAEGFLEDTISGIEKKVKAAKGDLKDLKISRGEKFNNNTAVLLSYVRVRGEKKDEFEDERQYLFRRNNALFTWTERANRVVSGQASGAFSSARSAFTFTSKDVSRTPKTWEEQGMKYTLPPDWEYEKVAESTDPKKIAPLMQIETAVTVKNQAWRLSAFISSQKFTGTLDDVEKQAKELLTKDFKEVQDYVLLEKQDLKGEKTIAASFTGVYVPEGPAPEQPRTRHRVFFAKRKGYLIRWSEAGPQASNPAVDAAFKKARDGLSWL